MILHICITSTNSLKFKYIQTQITGCCKTEKSQSSFAQHCTVSANVWALSFELGIHPMERCQIRPEPRLLRLGDLVAMGSMGVRTWILNDFDTNRFQFGRLVSQDTTFTKDGKNMI